MTSATALICYLSLSLSLSLSHLSLSLSLALFLSLGPSPSSKYIYQQSQRAKIFEHGVMVALAIGYSQKRISLTLLLL